MAEDTETIKAEQALSPAPWPREGSEIADIEEEKTKLVIFTLNAEGFAFFGADVKEILPFEEITFVPGSPDTITGIINVRGDIESVMNIHRVIDLPDASGNERCRIIIAEKDGVRSGILVDSVEEVMNIPLSSINPPISTLDNAKRELVVGEITVGESVVTILDVSGIFSRVIK